ncbi:MAG: Coenzyme F420 hydrogenase/dehydrogenase, beta subunit C-terminal domain [Candidatus Thorarchaeota archaeon]
MTRDHNTAVEKSQAWLKENTKRYAFKKLEREVVKTGACVECGSCVAGCPVDAITGEYVDSKYVPALTGKCIACGTCYAMCPRTSILQDDIIGDFTSVWKVRSLGDHKRQDGGAVTMILGHLLDKNEIEAAVVAGQSDKLPWMPVAKRVTTRDELLESGGTVYTHAQIIQEMHDCFKENLSSIGVVGTACNIDAIQRMQTHPGSYLNIDSKTDVFKVSLFCMESFDYNGLVGFLKSEGIDIGKVDRFAITKGNFIVTIGEEEKSWPVKDLDAIASSSCSYCTDLTGMNSDLSCGNIGSDDGWTTVLVRSKRGDKALKAVIKEGLVEAEEIDEKALQAVINTARSKKNKRFKLKPPH